MDTLIKVITYVQDYIAAVPNSSWQALGVLLGGSALVSGIIAWYNRHRVKQGLDRLEKHVVNTLVIILSSVVSFTGWIVVNGGTLGNFLGPWATHAVQIIGISTVIYNFSRPTLQWFKDRQAGKAISNPNLPNLTPAVQAVTSSSTVSGQPSSSMGSTSAGQTIQL